MACGNTFEDCGYSMIGQEVTKAAKSAYVLKQEGNEMRFEGSVFSGKNLNLESRLRRWK